MAEDNGVLLKLLQTVIENQQRDHQLVTKIPQMAEDIELIKAVQREQGIDLHHINNYLVEQGMPARA